MVRTFVVGVALLAPAMAWGETHGVTVRNGTGETIRGVAIVPAGSSGGGDNRLRSTLPPGSEGRFTYSTGCPADLRITFESGRSEDHKGLDVCTDPRIVAGQDGVAGPAGAPRVGGTPTAAGGATVGGAAVGKNGKGVANASTSTPVKAPPPVPPWTGKSITKRFGGMD